MDAYAAVLAVRDEAAAKVDRIVEHAGLHGRRRLTRAERAEVDRLRARVETCIDIVTKIKDGA